MKKILSTLVVGTIVFFSFSSAVSADWSGAYAEHMSKWITKQQKFEPIYPLIQFPNWWEEAYEDLAPLLEIPIDQTLVRLQHIEVVAGVASVYCDKRSQDHYDQEQCGTHYDYLKTLEQLYCSADSSLYHQELCDKIREKMRMILSLILSQQAPAQIKNLKHIINVHREPLIF